jgi:hypothetical protein
MNLRTAEGFFSHIKLAILRIGFLRIDLFYAMKPLFYGLYLFIFNHLGT